MRVPAFTAKQAITESICVLPVPACALWRADAHQTSPKPQQPGGAAALLATHCARECDDRTVLSAPPSPYSTPCVIDAGTAEQSVRSRGRGRSAVCRQYSGGKEQLGYNAVQADAHARHRFDVVAEHTV